MKNQKIVWLIIGLFHFYNLAFADVPGGGVRWPAQRIRFSNISSLGKFVLHVNYNYDEKEEIITSDTTFSFPEHGGAPSPVLKSFFATSDNELTNAVEIDAEDMDINFTGIKNNKLQFFKKINTASYTTTEELNKSDNPDNKSGGRLNKLYIGLSIAAFAGLILFFRFIKRQNQQNKNITPSA